MLIDFTFANYRSFREENSLNLTRLGSSERESTTIAAIYGSNASGKTNVLNALDFLASEVLSSQQETGDFKRTPFHWDNMREKPTSLSVNFVALDKVEYVYSVELLDRRVLSEELYAYPKKRPRKLFTRNESGIDFGGSFKGNKAGLASDITDRTLLLSLAGTRKIEALKVPYLWFFGVVDDRYGQDRSSDRDSFANLTKIFDLGKCFDSDGEADAIKSLLQAADLGISDMRLEEQAKDGLPVFSFRHGTDGDRWLPMQWESMGTRTLALMAQRILFALRYGGVLCVDELERNLHPAILLKIIDAFRPESNPRNAQLIFTTHDTNMLNELSTDQIWFTEKNKNGDSTLYPMSEFKGVRKEENLERGYLAGRFGAYPSVRALNVQLAKD